MEGILNFISSDFFANLCQFFSAFGTVSAVVVSLWLSIKKDKIKYSIRAHTIDVVSVKGFESGNNICGYCISLVNCSDEKNIYLRQGLRFLSDDFKKTKTINVIAPVIELNDTFPIEKNLGPGEEFEFFICEKQINSILRDSKKKRIKFYFVDKYNRKYSIFVRRTELEKRQEYLIKNKKYIRQF